jgi:hypothetical protein
MIPFFRKIRKKMADDNKPMKYMRYAIGEIVLVVVGILIALQINNWNTQLKLENEELRILNELKSVLVGKTIFGDLEFMKNRIKRNRESKASGDILIKYFQEDLPYDDSLNYHFANAHSRSIGLIKDHAYQNAKNYGLRFISNDSLKDLLVWTYETNSYWLLELNERNNLYENNIVYPILLELFENINFSDKKNRETISMIPLDFVSLKNNAKYRNILNSTINKREEHIHFQDKRYQRMLKIVQLLDKEIQTYN